MADKVITKTALITGANSGIGKQASIQLAAKGYHVFVGARNEKRGRKAVIEIKEQSNSDLVDLLLIDLSSKKSIAVAVQEVQTKISALDVLIHNAAAFDISQKEVKKSMDGIESIWATNHIGPVLLTNGLLNVLKKSEQARILTVSSKGLLVYPKLKVDLEDPEFENRKFSVTKAYYQSKRAQVMYTKHLAETLKQFNITANCIRVTNVKIDINRYPNISSFMKFMYSFKSTFSISPSEMAETYTYLATSPEVKIVSGEHFDEKNKVVKTTAYSSNKANIAQLMELTERYL